MSTALTIGIKQEFYDVASHLSADLRGRCCVKSASGGFVEDGAHPIQHTSMTAVQAYSVLTKNLPGSVYVTFIESSDQDDKIGMGVDMHADQDGETLFHYKGFFNSAQEGHLEGDLSVDSDTRGKGLGRAILKNQIELMAITGRKSFSFDAGEDAGGYAWARMGFLPMSEELDIFEANCADRVRERLEILTRLEILPLDIIEEARDIADFASEEAIWELADLDYDVMAEIENVVEYGVNMNGDPLESHLEASFYDEFEHTYRVARKGDCELSLGRLLLSGTHWPAKLDFDNSDQMQRIESYVGGFDYIELAQ